MAGLSRQDREQQLRRMTPDELAWEYLTSRRGAMGRAGITHEEMIQEILNREFPPPQQ